MSVRRRRVAGVVVLALVVAAGVALWRFVLARPAVPPGVLVVSGRIEGDDSAVAAKTSGRIREIAVREGDRVTAGQVIAVLDDEQIRAREQQAMAAVRQAEARVRLAQHQIDVLNEQLRQSRIGVDQSRADAEGRVNEAEGRLAAAEAQLAQAEASYAQAKWDREAATRLFQRELVAEQEARRAQNAEEAQAAVVAAQRRQVEAARGGLTAARAMLSNPAIRSSQVAAVQGQILQAQADIAAAQAEAERARAQLEEARANRKDLQIIAPFDGTVATRTAEPGEVVMAGTPVITLVNLGQVYLRAFVPEGQIGRVRIGQPARVYLDSAPATPIDAHVMRIDPQASFTPENTYFREDRVKQVVGVKLQLRGAVGFAKPGMPADGEILVDGEQWPARQARR
ncbi:MAG TPA: HlyD family efflux transporter periplasmic adaptor subunit [Methylomirabilota bacterium]|jgi:HlyD family secretion protein|nr:HlyD family efflux transporter periplasmic adaptor subunit [Methylomirabilota bacterium]